MHHLVNISQCTSLFLRRDILTLLIWGCKNSATLIWKVFNLKRSACEIKRGLVEAL